MGTNTGHFCLACQDALRYGYIGGHCVLCITVIQDDVLFDVDLPISTYWKLKPRNLKNTS